MKKISASLVLGIALLSGCAIAPDSIVQHPTTARPVVPTAAPVANGSIFQSASYRPMFEDRRARMIGDTLVIVINERTSAGKSAASSASKNGSVAVAAPSIFGLVPNITSKLNATGASEISYDDKSSGNSSNNFASTLTVTVIDVLPNGNLLVSGEKQVALDKGSEFIRFSGVVNPNTVTGTNTVSSTQVADARIEYRSNSQIDAAQVASTLARFFLSVLPL